MMVVLAGGIDQLVTSSGIAQVQTRDQPALQQQIENAIDARARDRPLSMAQVLFDFDRTERAGLAGEQVDDRVTGATFAISGLIEHAARMLSPLRSDSADHVFSLAHHSSGQRRE